MDEYQDYIEMKGWKDLFKYTKSEKWQFDKLINGQDLYNKKVLEIGFGSGSLLAYLKDKGANVNGVEIQPRLLDAAKEAGFVTAESVSDFANQSFDVIFALDVFEHLSPKELHNVLQLIDSLLVKNGLLIARFPNCQSPASLYNQFGDHTHKQMLSVPILEFYLKDTGLFVTKVKTGYSASEYTPNILVGAVKNVVRLVCQKIVKIGLGYSDNTLAANILTYARKRA